MLVNGRQTRMLVLLNDGNCTLHYRLFLQQSHPEAVGNGPLGTQAGVRGTGSHWLTRPWSGDRT